MNEICKSQTVNQKDVTIHDLNIKPNQNIMHYVNHSINTYTLNPYLTTDNKPDEVSFLETWCKFFGNLVKTN